MNNLQEATERICELKGSLVALDALVPAVLGSMSRSARARLMASFDEHAEAARTVMLHADISDVVLATFERDVERNKAVLRSAMADNSAGVPEDTVDPLMLATTRIVTHAGSRVLTSASGFFFRRNGRLFLVTNRHVFADAASDHRPDRIEFGVHTDEKDLTRYTVVSLPLFRDRLSQWREATDTGGAVDVAAIEIPEACLPPHATFQAFDPSDVESRGEHIAVGDALTIAGFPLGFHDTVHHLAVARSASMASSYGIRFQQQGYFLTDARTHQGSSGSPVVRRRLQGADMTVLSSWQLLGVHSTRMDISSRDRTLDESLGLNCAWYADVLLPLTTGDLKAGEAAS